MSYIVAADAKDFIDSLEPQSVHLCCVDPPYHQIVSSNWDNVHKNDREYSDWLVGLIHQLHPKMHPHGSLICFGGIGKHNSHPIFDVVRGIEEKFYYRNWITWMKRRSYGKSHDYLFVREEFLWYSVSPNRTDIFFNVPLLNEKRGFAGFNKKYPAKSEYKRVGNVWTDIPELMRTEREAQKPIPLLERIIQTHSMPGQLVVDFFSGWGTTGVAAIRTGRRFLGCEKIAEDAEKANQRCEEEAAKQK